MQRRNGPYGHKNSPVKWEGLTMEAENNINIRPF